MTEIYTGFVTRIINREFSIAADKVTFDVVKYWINKFFCAICYRNIFYCSILYCCSIIKSGMAFKSLFNDAKHNLLLIMLFKVVKYSTKYFCFNS